MGFAGVMSYKHIYPELTVPTIGASTASKFVVPKPAPELGSGKLAANRLEVKEAPVPRVTPTVREAIAPQIFSNAKRLPAETVTVQTVRPVRPVQPIRPIQPVNPAVPPSHPVPSALEHYAGRTPANSTPVGFSLKESEFENFGVQQDRFNTEPLEEAGTNPSLNELFAEMWEEKRPLSGVDHSDPHAEVHDPWMPANNLDPYGNVLK